MRNYTISSPAFIYDLPIIQDTLLRIKKIETETACKILFAIKSCSLSKIIQLVSEELDGGFASSSLFETRLIRDIVGNDCEIHLTTPVFLDLDSRDIMRLCSHIYFNSTNLFQKYSHMKKTYDFKCGLRINPGLSSVNDSRYNPCGFASKLGTPIDLLNKEFDLSLLDSIHFHTNCDSDDYETLWHIVLLLDEKIPNILEKISSINLGGGYLYSKNVDLDKLSSYGTKIIFQPQSMYWCLKIQLYDPKNSLPAARHSKQYHVVHQAHIENNSPLCARVF